MATMTKEQIEQKKAQLKQLTAEVNQLINELKEAGAWPLDDDDLDMVTGGAGPNGKPGQYAQIPRYNPRVDPIADSGYIPTAPKR
jgi:hypothetical protein